jgi:hypothetical protein
MSGRNEKSHTSGKKDSGKKSTSEKTFSFFAGYKYLPVFPGIIVAVILFFLVLTGLNPLFFLPDVITYFLISCLTGSIIISLFLKKDISEARNSCLEILCVFAVLSLFVLLKLQAVHETDTDENIYFYAAKRFSDGVIPYRDFFFAHPPMHLIIPAVIFYFSGFNIFVAKLIPLCAALASGLLLYAAVRRKASFSMAILALTFFYFNYQLLMASSDMTGVNLTCVFMMLGFYFASGGRPFLSGMAFGISALTGFYMASSFAAVLLVALFGDRVFLFIFFTGFVSTFLPVMLIFLFIGGENFLQGVFIYHFLKPAKDSRIMGLFDNISLAHFLKAFFNNIYVFISSRKFLNSLYFHSPYFLSALISVPAVIRSLLKPEKRDFFRPKFMLRGPQESIVQISLLILFLFLVQFSMLKEVYDFYLVLMMPFLSILLAYVFDIIANHLYSFFFMTLFSKKPPLWKNLIIPVSLAAVFSLWIPLAYLLNSYFPDENKQKGEKVEYQWRESMLLPALDPAVKFLFYRDSRIRGEIEPFYRHFLWNKKLTFTKVQEISGYITGNSTFDETIAGASTIAPILALYSGRNIAADEVDTNAKRFKTEMISEKDYFNRICSTRLRFIISAPMSYFDSKRMDEHPVIKKYFRKDMLFEDEQLKHFYKFPIQLYRRIDGTEPDANGGIYCRME